MAEAPLHSSGDTTRLTAWFVGCIWPVCALLTNALSGGRLGCLLAPAGAVQRGLTTGCQGATNERTTTMNPAIAATARTADRV